MELAINEAWKYQLLTYPNPAVGAVVLKSGKLLSVEAHKEAGLPHAEVNALKSAYLKEFPASELNKLNNSKDIHQFLIENHNGFFNDCEIYVTLEPCNHIGKTPACAALLEVLMPKRVIIGAEDPNEKAAGGIKRLEKAGIRVDAGVMEKRSNELIAPFVEWMNGNFTFFKLAMRMDGSIGGGYISSKRSLELVHKIRTKIDVMIIGGNTVRIDRPKLDSRFAAGKNPDICIYSKKDSSEFDETIPLFNVKDREVIVTSSRSDLKKNRFCMIEGGYGLLDILIDEIDMLMLIVSPKMDGGNVNSLQKEFDIQHQYFNGFDNIIFLKRKI